MLDFQTAITKDHLYEVSFDTLGESKKGGIYKYSRSPNLYANAATSIYGSQSATMPTALSEMYLDADNPNFVGLSEMTLLPRWLAFTGSATEIVISNVNLVDKGAIS